MLRFLTAGESHGPALVTIVEGLPAGLPVEAAAIDRHLARRQAGYGRGRRMQIEHDRVEILSGVRHGRTLGSPVALRIPNRDYETWQWAMHPASVAPPPNKAEDWRLRPVSRPRPGHADLAGALKYGFSDVRNVLERASARETAARVAAGSLARLLVEQAGVRLLGHVVAIGSAHVSWWGDDHGAADSPVTADLEGAAIAAEESPVRCVEPQAAQAMMEAIDAAAQQGDTLGGIVEVVAVGVPPGLGSHVHWDRRLDGRLAAGLASIPGVKGVEIGPAFANAGRPGSRVHDPIQYGPAPPGHFSPAPDRPTFVRPTNRAGGLEGGITTGQPVVVRAAMKPLSTLMHPLPSVDLVSHEPFEAAVERSDVCAVPSAAVVAEAMVAWVLAEALLEKFPADDLEALRLALDAYRERLLKR